MQAEIAVLFDQCWRLHAVRVVDQFEAFLRDNMQINEEFDENSPWRYLDDKA